MIATVNPATGEMPGHVRRAHRIATGRQTGARRRGLPHVSPHHLRRPRRLDDPRRRDPGSGEGCVRAHHDARNGQAAGGRRAEAAKCATACRYYVEHAERLLADELVDTGGPMSFIRYQPIGAGARRDALEFSVLAGLPLPRARPDGGQRGPAQARLQRAAMRARDRRHRARARDFPADVFQTLLIGASRSRGVIDDPRVKAVTLTGSEPAGRAGGGAGRHARSRSASWNWAAATPSS